MSKNEHENQVTGVGRCGRVMEFLSAAPFSSAKLHVLFFGLRVLNKEQKEQKV